MNLQWEINIFTFSHQMAIQVPIFPSYPRGIPPQMGARQWLLLRVTIAASLSFTVRQSSEKLNRVGIEISMQLSEGLWTMLE